MARLFAATGDAIARIDSGDGHAVRVSLAGSGAQCVAVDPRDRDVVYAGLRSGGVRKSEDGGATWRDVGLPEPQVFSLAVSPADGAVYAGCEPSMLFRSDGGGDAWTELEALRRLPSAPTWSFPPRPWTSHVRWIAPSPHEAGRILVGIELGGVMLTVDGGETWADHRPGAQPDVHALAWHPAVEGRAYEAGGGGAAWSHDGGWTWEAADAGRDRHYTWALAVDREDPDCWWISASTGPRAAHGGRDPQARIYRWRGTGPWQPLSGGLPEPLNSMPYALAAADGRLFAGFADGRIYASADGGDSWERLALDGAAVTRLLALAPAP